MIIPSLDRTLAVGTYVGIAPRGRIASQTPLRWRNKQAGTTLDYSLDLTTYLADAGGDSVLSAVAAISPSQIGSVLINTVQINGPVITLIIAQGVAGVDYAVAIGVKFASGRYVIFTAGLYVEAPVFPLPTAPYVLGAPQTITTDAGAAITNTIGVPITSDGVAPTP